MLQSGLGHPIEKLSKLAFGIRTCKVVISAQPETVSTTTLRNTYGETQDKRNGDIFGAFDSCGSTNALHNAWKL